MTEANDNLDVFGDEPEEQTETPEPVATSTDMTAKNAIAAIEEYEGTEDQLKEFIVGETRLTVLKAARVLLGDDAPAVDVASGTKPSKKGRRYLIEIDEQENMTNSQEVGVNGKVYQIKRGEPVEVNEEVMEVLKNAMGERLVQRDTGGKITTTSHKFSAVPYRVLEVLD